MHLHTPQPLLQFLNTLLPISEAEQSQVHGASGVEALVSGVIRLLQNTPPENTIIVGSGARLD